MFASTADELKTFFRAEADDKVAPYLWADWEIYGYMTEGFDDMLKRTQARFEILRLAYAAGTETIPLPAKVVHIRSARIVGGSRLADITMDDAAHTSDDYGIVRPADMFDSVPGRSSAFVRDYDQRALRLVPRPATAGELELQCSVTLSVPMEEGVLLPTTDSQELRLVLHFMLSRAYQKHDAEAEDLVRARFHEDRYRAGVLEREHLLLNQRRPPGAVRMHGW